MPNKLNLPSELPPVPEPGEVVPPESRVTEPAREEAPVVEPTVETKQPILPFASASARGCRKAQPEYWEASQVLRL